MKENRVGILAQQGFLKPVEKLITFRLSQYFGRADQTINDGQIFTVAEDVADGLGLSQPCSNDEKLIVLIALAPHLYPAFYDRIIQEFLPNGGDILEMGGVKNTGNHRGFLPTGETALFILAGDDPGRRLAVQQLLMGQSRLVKDGVLYVEAVKAGEPPMSGKLVIVPEWLSKLLFAKETLPVFGPDFPAKAISTRLSWKDLVIAEKTREQLHDIKVWLQHNRQLLDQWGMQKVIKPGYRALFYGPPGTGKTLTATLLGQEFEREVFRIDLSQVVSKYIGETEKNLEKVFQRAEHRDWILFFDEADALFGKRSSVQNAHDRYANQEVSYLLQRVEDFSGLVILASNFKNNVDKAFMRRFNAVIHFPVPTAAERLRLWQSMLPAKAGLADPTVLTEIADKYELSGSSIVQAVHFATLRAFSRQDGGVSKADIIDGIRREFEKEDRVFR